MKKVLICLLLAVGLAVLLALPEIAAGMGEAAADGIANNIFR